MKTITELRDAFAAWPQGNDDNFQHLRDDVTARNIVEALRDPTPITEAGLRELGYTPRTGTIWGLKNHPDIIGPIGGQIMLLFATSEIRVKSMGRLRMLLLSVGE